MVLSLNKYLKKKATWVVNMILKGTDFYLRFLEVSDAEALASLRQRNRSFFEQFLVDQPEEFYSIDYQISAIKKGKALRERDQQYTFAIFFSGSDKLIGVVSLTEIVRGPLQSCWIGYYLDQAYNGRGIMTGAVRLVVDYAFRVLKLHRVEAGVMPHNKGSIRVVEKAGFELEGLNKKNVLINGKWEGHLHFAIVNPED
jgi:ribosomal-protein-alanine N-acetyltransferase